LMRMGAPSTKTLQSLLSDGQRPSYSHQAFENINRIFLLIQKKFYMLL